MVRTEVETWRSGYAWNPNPGRLAAETGTAVAVADIPLFRVPLTLKERPRLRLRLFGE